MFFHDTVPRVPPEPTVPWELPWELEELEELAKIYSSINIAVNESVVAFFKKKVDSVNATSLLYFTK
jgi:hypothetical protein